MAPLHIGSGDTYTQKEYIYEKGYYYFPDMGKVYQEIQQKGSKVTETFESFLMQSGNRNNRQNPRLVQFLNDQRITTRNFGGYSIKETKLELEADKKTPKGNINEVSAFIKDSYNMPYIPGSSLKGAIRTILVNQHFKGDQIPWGAKQGTQFSDIFHSIRVSDSKPLSATDLILAQKWDYSSKKSEAKPLPVYRECIKPFTAIHFTITAIGEEAIQLLDSLGPLSNQQYEAYKRRFLKDFPSKYLQKNVQYPLYLGAGSGFWTKTYMDKADPSRFRRGKMKMVGNGVLKLTKAPSVKYKVNGEIRHLINNPDNLYEFGKCNFLIKPLEGVD